jgi:two-component system sensor histidine kinase AlgZ
MKWSDTTTWATSRLALSPSPSWMAPVDWCSGPVVLRALLWGNGLGLLVALAMSRGLAELARACGQIAAFLEPGLLLWLLLCCATKRITAKLASAWQYAVVLGFAALSALFAQALARLVFPPEAPLLPAPWAMAMAVMGAAPLFHYLLLRQRAAVPRAQQAHLADLEQRIRPHFLFNSLNAVSALISIDPRKAEAALDDLAELFRMLTRRPSGLMLLSEEVELAKRYLAIEHLRFGERMQVQWRLDEALLATPVPTLCLQPLVENAVKHGVERTAGVATITIAAQLEGGRLKLQVINTATQPMAYRESAGTGTALDNLRERLRLVYDIAADWEVKPLPDQFQVTLWLPL